MVEWEHFNATTNVTAFLIDRLKPGNRYKVAVTAHCIVRTPSPELLMSSKDTGVFKTKGKLPLPYSAFT